MFIGVILLIATTSTGTPTAGWERETIWSLCLVTFQGS